MVSDRNLDAVRQAVTQAITIQSDGVGVCRDTGTEGRSLLPCRRGQRRTPGGCHLGPEISSHLQEKKTGRTFQAKV